MRSENMHLFWTAHAPRETLSWFACMWDLPIEGIILLFQDIICFEKTPDVLLGTIANVAQPSPEHRRHPALRKRPKVERLEHGQTELGTPTDMDLVCCFTDTQLAQRIAGSANDENGAGRHAQPRGNLE